jgi:ArsR family transcriptional regulator
MGQRVPGFDAGGLAALFPAALEPAACRTLPPEPGAKGPGLVVASARRPAARR